MFIRWTPRRRRRRPSRLPGRLEFVGDARRARALLRPGGRTIELAPGQTVLPGLVDSHVHLIEGACSSATAPSRSRRARRRWPRRSSLRRRPTRGLAHRQRLARRIVRRARSAQGGARRARSRPASGDLRRGRALRLGQLRRVPGRRHRPGNGGSVVRPHRAPAGQPRTVRHVTRAACDGPGRRTCRRGRRGLRGCTGDRAAAPARARHHARSGCPSQPALPGCLSRRSDVRGSDHEGGRGAGDRSAPASLAGR